MNPCDDFNASRAPVSEKVTAATLGGAGKFVILAVEWNENGEAVIFIDGREIARRKFLMPKFGFSYLHVQSLSDKSDAEGSWFRFFRKTVKKLYVDHS